MRLVTQQTRDAWLTPEKVGEGRPMVRATIQRISLLLTPYTNISVNPLERLKDEIRGGVPGTFASCVFGQRDRPVELPNIKSFQWSRSVDQEVAEATLVLWNTQVLPLGATPGNSGGYELPGYFTYRHGAEAAAVRWGQATNGWRDYLVPDRMVRTWEGYGFDPMVGPEDDPNQYPSGVWLIDDVQYTADGLITVGMRDCGRLLQDQLAFPPVVSFQEYPVSFSPFEDVDNPDEVVSSEAWFRPNYQTDSNQPYTDYDFTDGGRPYVQDNGAVNGHHGRHAFDNKESTYWLSVGNAPNWSSAYEWVQGRFSSRQVGAVRFRPWAGPYRVYISVYANGEWKGKKKIPYRARVVDTNADIKFVKAVRVGKGDWKTVKLPRVYNNATRIRLTFTDLYDSGIGQYRYRAGCRSVEVSGSVTKTRDGGTHVEGDFDDFTQVVKKLLAWGGYYWPTEASGNSVLTNSDGSVTTIANQRLDNDLRTTADGGVWGDFENTGTAPLTELGIEIFDKQPLLDGILHIRNIVGFLFYTDETGAAVFRSPNIWEVGNYVTPAAGGPNAGRTTNVLEIRDDQVVTQLGSTISSRNVRDRYVIGTGDGEYGAVVDGHVAMPTLPLTDLRRVGMWTDQHFASNEECQIMADLISVRAMYTYRTNRLTIPGNPAIQIDDQVRIAERLTADTYLHYVQGISSDFDMETRKWTYDLETFWLGEQPFQQWTFDPTLLTPETKEYLTARGSI